MSFYPDCFASDLNGDGFFDVIMVDPKGSNTYAQSGVVRCTQALTAVSRQNPCNFGGWRRDMNFGHDVAVADLNGDSIKDL